MVSSKKYSQDIKDVNIFISTFIILFIIVIKFSIILIFIMIIRIIRIVLTKDIRLIK